MDSAELEVKTEDKPAAEENPANGDPNEESPDIGDLEEREEEEMDDIKTEGNGTGNGTAENGKQEQKIPHIHDISDEEDMGEELIYDDTMVAVPTEKTEDKKADDASLAAVENKPVKEEVNKDESKTTAAPAKPSRVPHGLSFPKDDPHGLRCIWIRGIPHETTKSVLEVKYTYWKCKTKFWNFHDFLARF